MEAGKRSRNTVFTSLQKNVTYLTIGFKVLPAVRPHTVSVLISRTGREKASKLSIKRKRADSTQFSNIRDTHH